LANWKSFLNNFPTDWLLEEENPSVRYLTLVNILGKSEKDQEVKQVKKDVMNKGVVPKLLAKQNSEGYWGKPEDFYIRSKYKGTVWTFLLLAQLNADGKDKRIKKICEFILNISQDRRSGGFSYQGNTKNGGYHSKVSPCLTGNMIWCLIRFGYLHDQRVQQGINWITTYQRFDDKIPDSPKGWPYDKNKNCWGKHTCHMGVVKALKALSEIPIEKRSFEVKNTIKEGVEYLLKHHIHKRSHNLDKISKPTWFHFGFPLMWQTDSLEILGILVKLGYKDNRMQDAVNLLLSKQDSNGRWMLESTFYGRMQVNIERKGKPSKWITYHCLRVLKDYYS
jgi:hypothetical protein